MVENVGGVNVLMGHRRFIDFVRDTIDYYYNRSASLNFEVDDQLRVATERVLSIIDNFRLAWGRDPSINDDADINMYFSSILESVLAVCPELNSSFKVMDYAHFLWSKHIRYGSDQLTNWRYMAILIDIGRKAERIRNLLIHAKQNASLPQNKDTLDSINDSVKDLIGYSILGLMLYKVEYMK